MRLYTRNQARIAVFIRSLIRDPADASDVMQETSLTLWRSFSQYDRNLDFGSWAVGIARNQVLKLWRIKRRDQELFSDSLFLELADEVEANLSNSEQRLQALRDCVQRLTTRQRELIKDFYGNGVAAAEVARRWNRNLHTVYNALRSLRKELGQCIAAELNKL